MIGKELSEVPPDAIKVCTFYSDDVAAFYAQALFTAKVSFGIGKSIYHTSCDLFILKKHLRKGRRVLELASTTRNERELSGAHRFLYSDN